MSATPEGAITQGQGLELKQYHPKTKIYYVGEAIGVKADSWGVVVGTADEFMFTREAPEHYFLNYFLALGYAVRFKGVKDHA